MIVFLSVCDGREISNSTRVGSGTLRIHPIPLTGFILHRVITPVPPLHSVHSTSTVYCRCCPGCNIIPLPPSPSLSFPLSLSLPRSLPLSLFSLCSTRPCRIMPISIPCSYSHPLSLSMSLQCLSIYPFHRRFSLVFSFSLLLLLPPSFPSSLFLPQNGLLFFVIVWSLFLYPFTFVCTTHLSKCGEQNYFFFSYFLS